MLLDKYNQRTNVLKALSNPIRLFIIDEIAKEEKCICEIAQMLDVDLSSISKHVNVLKNAGVIIVEKRGKNVYPKLLCPCVLDLFSCIESVIINKHDYCACKEQTIESSE